MLPRPLMLLPPDPKPLAPVGVQLRDWYAAPAGAAVARALHTALEGFLPDLFGYHAVQLGLAVPELLRSSRIPHRVLIDADAAEASLRAAPERLPILADGVDLVLLTHVLEFSPEPHQVLREVERALLPEGHVVLIGFNPASLYGAWKLGAGWRGRAPWSGRFITPYRLKDWLALLGFDVLDSRPCGFLPPAQRPGVQRRLGFLETAGARWWPWLGGVYVLLARKRVATLRPIRPRWRPRRALVGGGRLAGSSSRGYGRHRG
jgi:SAM-dependent methyltransferase